MRFTYTPEGADERVWEFAAGKMRSRDAEDIERVTKMPFRGGFLEALLDGSVLAQRALLWVYLRRDVPSLKFDQVDFALDEVELTFDDAELEEILTATDTERAKGTLTEDQAQAAEAMAALWEERHGTPWKGASADDDADAEDEDPKEG